MQEMQFASFASSEWKGVVGTLPGIDTQGGYSAATRYSILQVPFPSTAR